MHSIDRDIVRVVSLQPFLQFLDVCQFNFVFVDFIRSDLFVSVARMRPRLHFSSYLSIGRQ